MIRLSQLIAAAESAPMDRLERALHILQGLEEQPELLTSDEVCERFRISRRTVYRRLKPAETLAGKHWYRADQVKQALAS